ncbi:hypothetical protein Tco_0933094, partial [Tanacetum coccineum]
ADGAQSSRVPIPLPEYPYEAIRQTYLVGTDAESEIFEDPVETEAPESPHTVTPPTSPPDSTLPTLVPILRRTARMAVRVPPEMSPGFSASMAEVATMSDLAFRKRFRSSYKSSPSSSPLDLPSRKRYQGTSELVKDDKEEEDDEEGDDEEEDEEMEESLDSYSVSKDVEDEGSTAEDEDPAAGDEGRDEAVPGGQQRATLVAETTVDEPLGLGYEALRCWEIALGEGRMPSVFEVDPGDGIVYIDVPVYPPPAPPVQTPPSPKWSSGSLPISPAPSIVPSPISSPMIPLTVPSLELSPALFERYDRDIGELFTRSGQSGMIFSPRDIGLGVKRMHREKLCGMPSVIRKERTGCCDYSSQRRDVRGWNWLRLSTV